ncbi:DinB family protein [Winogradskyella sp. DF17]|uniref:DinB family protein n=1 Tax=Winogradskyella pelagia TaxID=2819984 RepID=A0ABS3T0U3_9FLAO|nr:DinB family protein [Winogradskyella sp. DF17]MBO3116360.1 DinB family protein [Winogradskyella sp. DF17]
MEKESIANLIDEKYSALIEWIENHPDELWTHGPEGKWTTGQHVLHVLQSTIPLNNALSLPKFVVRYRFGKANRAVREYDAIIKRYKERLEQSKGKTFKGSQNMKIPTLSDKHYLINRIQTESKKLQYKTKRISEKNLDTLVLPHPLMGKMPVREIIMWSAYHVEHHLDILKKKYS